MYWWICLPLLHFLPFARPPLSLPLTASLLPRISYFQEGPGPGVNRERKIAAGDSAGLAGARGPGSTGCSSFPGAAPPWTFVEPGARAQMQATYHLRKHIKVVNQINKLLTKIQLQMDKIEKICVKLWFCMIESWKTIKQLDLIIAVHICMFCWWVGNVWMRMKGYIHSRGKQWLSLGLGLVAWRGGSFTYWLR